MPRKKLIGELTPEEEKRAEEVYKKAIVIEGLTYGPTLLDPKYPDTLKESGVTATHFTALAPEDEVKEALLKIAFWLELEQNNIVKIIRTVDDIVEAKRNGEVGIILGSQDLRYLQDHNPENCVKLVNAFHQLGMRIIELAYLQQNYFGSAGVDKDAGLTIAGRKLVEEMNRVGVLIDVSHCGDNTVMDTINCSQKPVAFTHANPRAIVDHPRNKSDEQILAITEKGGFIGICSFAPISQMREGVHPTIEDLLDMIDYVVNLAGIDAVGIGLDLTPNWDFDPRAFEEYAKENPLVAAWMNNDLTKKNAKDSENCTKIINFAKGLVARGYSDEDIMKILGGNFLELFRKVW